MQSEKTYFNPTALKTRKTISIAHRTSLHQGQESHKICYLIFSSLRVWRTRGLLQAYQTPSIRDLKCDFWDDFRDIHFT